MESRSADRMAIPERVVPRDHSSKGSGFEERRIGDDGSTPIAAASSRVYRPGSLFHAGLRRTGSNLFRADRESQGRLFATTSKGGVPPRRAPACLPPVPPVEGALRVRS